MYSLDKIAFGPQRPCIVLKAAIVVSPVLQVNKQRFTGLGVCTWNGYLVTVHVRLKPRPFDHRKYLVPLTCPVLVREVEFCIPSYCKRR